MLNVKKAVILAAGMGLRLQPITHYLPKCLVEVNGRSLLTRAINALESQGFDEVIVVTGFKNEMIEAAIKKMDVSIRIKTVHNEIYDSTNNIYSLWLVNDVVNEPFLLMESDLILEDEIYGAFTQPDRIALDNYDPLIHSGTTVTINNLGIVDRMFIKKDPEQNTPIFKTVNVYSFSIQTWNLLRDKIAEHIDACDVNIFYEVAINSLIKSGQIEMEMVDFSRVMWHEIDSISDYERVVHATTLEFSN